MAVIETVVPVRLLGTGVTGVVAETSVDCAVLASSIVESTSILLLPVSPDANSEKTSKPSGQSVGLRPVATSDRVESLSSTSFAINP